MPGTFRLQSVLEHKRQQEDRQALAFAALDAACRRTREALQALRREEAEQLSQIAALSRQGAIDVQRYYTAISYLGHIEGSIARQATAVTEAEQRVLEGRDALLAILKDRRALERLRERQAADALIAEGRREVGRVDEITAARYARRAGEGA